MTPSHTCPQCGASLPVDAPESLCPACLMAGALPSNFDTVKLAAPPWSQGARVKYVGNYELLEEIATGGMGVVWKARQTKLDRMVAVKMIRGGVLAGADDVQRFHAEAQAAANLKHPNIVGIHEVGEHEGQHYYSMDFIEGRTLADVCGGKPMNAREAASLLQTICDAVNFAHQRGILHRDLKPHNILLDAEGRPHVLDFGLAKRLDDDQGLTMSGAVLGSPSYMAPEQAQGRNDRVGPHTDVYALGAILYQMLTGRAPFLASSAAETMMQVVQRDPVAPSNLNADVPRDLETICLKCLEKEPARRYATARELGEELGRFLKGEPILSRPASAVRKTVSWLRRHPGTLAGIAAMFVFVLLCFVFYLFHENAFLHAKQLNPGLERKPGELTKALRDIYGWLGLMFLALLIDVWFAKHARRTSWRELRKSRFRPLLPVPAHVRNIYGVVGAICACYGFLLIAKAIEALVWEGGEKFSADTVVRPFLTVWCGFLMMLTSWRDYVVSTHGAPSRKIDDATRDAIRLAVEELDFAGAIKLYRRAVPEAGRPEARDYAMRIAAEFNETSPARFEALANPPWWDVNRRNMGICAALEIALGTFLWLQIGPADPLKSAGFGLLGFAYGTAIVIGRRVRRTWIRFLLYFGPLMPLFILLHGDRGGAPTDPIEHLVLMIFGFNLGLFLMLAGYKRKRKKNLPAA